MELVMPGIGLIFWTTVAFGMVLIILRKFAWKPILYTIKERENYIAQSLKQSKRIQRELDELDNTKEKLMIQAKATAEEIIQKARIDGEQIVKAAQQKAQKEASQLINDAHNAITAERRAVEKEIRQQIALLSVDIAKHVIQDEFNDIGKKNKYVNKLLEDIPLN